MPKTVPPLEASIHIDAPPSVVWEIVADQRRMNEFSPETWKQKFFGDEIGVGTISVNLNKRKGFVWPTASRITELEPEKRIAFYVYGPADTWSYDLVPEGAGTKLVERRELKDGKRSLASRITASIALGGIEGHDAELVEGMRTTLERIKAEAERSA